MTQNFKRYKNTFYKLKKKKNLRNNTFSITTRPTRQFF